MPRAPRSPAEMRARLPACHPLSWYRPGRRVRVRDRMQRTSYVLAQRPGRALGFRPEVSPARMLALGVFEGKYLNDCMGELPREWYARALRAGRLSPQGPDPALNALGVKSRLSLREWRANGWIPAAPGDQDVRGWFQWYARYWLGRRQPAVDAVQIARWRAFARHRGAIRASLRGRRPLSLAQMRAHRPRQRQALLQWAYNPFKV